MTDQSHLDSHYFIDSKSYNCPFCKRRHVSYSILSVNTFDWSDEKTCAVIIVKCRSCAKRSLHLTFHKIWTAFNSGPQFDSDVNIDEAVFYSVPTSFFALDRNIPRILRELFVEAEGCLKSSFLTGASACARKLIYELAVDQDAQGGNYSDRIRSLKGLCPNADSTYFDMLLTIQEVTSTKVHENSYDGWKSNHLRLILATIAEILREIYVTPNVRKDRREAILDLKKTLMGDTSTADDSSDHSSSEKEEE